MASTVNGSASEGELGGFPMENNGRLSHDIFPKYKWRKVSAIRDYPPGCGRFAPQINLTQKADIASREGIDKFVGADDTGDILRNISTSQSPPVAQSSGHTDTHGQINDLDTKQASSKVVLDQVDGLESIGVEPMSQLPGALEGSNDIILNGPLQVSDLETSELLKSPQQENICSREQHLVLPERPSDSPALEGSNDTGLSGLLKVSELETSKSSEDPHEVHVPVFEDLIQSWSLDARLITVPKGNGLEKHLIKDYPPPRKVFAVRDFPPFCGRNALCLEEAEKIREKKTREHNQGGDAHENKLEENGLTTVSRVQDAQGDTTEKSIKSPCVSNRYSRDETAVEKGNMDAKNLKKTTEKEIVIYKKNCLKRKVPDVSGSSEQLREKDREGLEGASRRMIVHGLAAAPNSLERQDKMLRKSNMAGVASEIKGKKRGYLENSKYAAGRMNDKSKLSGIKSVKMKSPTQEIECHETEATRRQYSGDMIVYEKDNMEVGCLPRNAGKEIMIYTGKRSPGGKLSDISGSQGQLIGEDCEDLEVVSSRTVVHALWAGGNSVGRQRKVSSKLNPVSGTSGNKGKKHALTYLDDSEYTVRRKKDESKDSGSKSKKIMSPTIGTVAHHSTSQLIVLNEDSSEDEEEIDDFHVAVRSRKSDLCLPPFGHSDLSSKGNERDGCVTRNKVRETLRLFQAVCRKILQEEETKLKEQGTPRKRIDLAAARILKEKGKYVNTGEHILGSVPGVEVGDEFHYRVELNIIGIHRQIQGGIDYMKHDGEVLATSIVASGGYADELDNSDFLIYTGQGGNMMGGDKEPEDQKLERGNLALKTSIFRKNPVRVIRGFKDTKSSDSSDARGRQVVVMTYIYDGLYLVEKSWQEEGGHGKLVFKFLLVRVPGQPELAWKQVKKSDKCRVREGLCDKDISQGKEIIPICAVNTIDDEKPPQFEYITRMIYPDWCRPIPPKGCDCTRKCSESKKCSCAIMNGGEIPYNYNGAIVEAKPLVHECGPLCKCPPSCPNRVSQYGIRFQLEIFKTESRGWGVRSLNSIASGSFICEYAGELLEEKEADARTGNDEYLFDIGHNYNDTALWGGLSTLMPDASSNSSEIVEDGFTIDAAQYGNIGRFINHSCSPNLYAQNVLYDHEDKRVPHIMFFAAENIPPLQELTYHYNYTIDQVRDSNGNIKKKSCYCGAADCTGRMY